jgi:hypothetical protein
LRFIITGVKNSVKKTTGIGTWMDEETLKGLAGATQIGAAVAFAYVAYVPVAAAVGVVAGKNAARKWQPYLQELFREVDPALMLLKKLGEELNKFHSDTTAALSAGGDLFQVATQRGVESHLQADIQHIQLKHCQDRGSLCLQVSLRARLWKVPEKRLLIDKVLVYNSSVSSKLKPSEIMVLGTSPSHSMEDYCGASGKQIFREELSIAIDKLAKRLYLEIASFPQADVTNRNSKVSLTKR